MAKYAKLAGMTSGLAIGLGGGVLLAVMNPLIPNEDVTKVEIAPSAVQTTLAQQDAVPVIGGADAGAVVAPAVDQPAVGSADSVPLALDSGNVPVQPGTVDGLVAPLDDTTQAVDLMMTKPATVANPVQAGNLPKVVVPISPKIATASATPLVIPEPQIDSASVTVKPVQPAADLALDIVAPKASAKAGQKDVPQQIAPAPDVVAALPTIPEPKRRVNKKGTFDTKSSRLATTGTAGFSVRKTDDSGIKFPKIATQNPSGIVAEPTNEAADDTAVEIGALRRNAVAFAGADKPLLSIVLIDIGEKGLPLETLKKLTIPAAFALPADQADVGELAQGYSKAGFEVLALSPRKVDMSLSGGLSQDQVDGVIGKIFADLPQAIGLIDRPVADLQKDRKLVKSVVNSFASTGHGLLTYSGGLNPVPRAAKAANVATSTVYRVLDGKGESPEIMVRVLNRAVFEARHNGRVILLGTTAAETVATIVNWTLSPKARGVTLAPVSANLLLGNP